MFFRKVVIFLSTLLKEKLANVMYHLISLFLVANKKFCSSKPGGHIESVQLYFSSTVGPRMELVVTCNSFGSMDVVQSQLKNILHSAPASCLTTMKDYWLKFLTEGETFPPW